MDFKTAAIRGIKEELGIELGPEDLIELEQLKEEGKETYAYPLGNINTFINGVFLIKVDNLPPEISETIPILRTDAAGGPGGTKKLIGLDWVDPKDTRLWPPDPTKEQSSLSKRLERYMQRVQEYESQHPVKNEPGLEPGLEPGFPLT